MNPGLSFVESGNSPPQIQPDSNQINLVYLQYQTASSANKEFFQSRLLEEVRTYAIAIIRKSAPKLGTIDDVAQEAVIKVWSSLDQFHNGSKFSTWCYPIIRRTMIDFIRATKRKREVELLEWKAYDEPTSQSIENIPDASETSDNGEDIDDEVYRAPISKQQRERTKNLFITQYDTDTVIQKLQSEGQQLLNLSRMGYSPSDLAERFGSTQKQITNRLNYIRILLKHELTVYEVRLHTCNPGYQSQYKLDAGQYISDGKSYRQLPEKCLCRKQLTRLESKRLIELGEVQHIFRQGENNKPIIDSATVWAAQAVRVPRVGLISAERLKDRRHQTDLEIAHEMDVMALQALIVSTERSERHPYGGDNPTLVIRSWVGRPRLTDSQDQRTNRDKGTSPRNDSITKFDAWVLHPSHGDEKGAVFHIWADGSLSIRFLDGDFECFQPNECIFVKNQNKFSQTGSALVLFTERFSRSQAYEASHSIQKGLRKVVAVT